MATSGAVLQFQGKVPDFATLNPGYRLVAPAGTPAVIATLNREIAAIIADKGFHERMAKIGVDVVGTTADAYAKITRDDFVRWGKVVKASGIEPQ